MKHCLCLIRCPFENLIVSSQSPCYHPVSLGSEMHHPQILIIFLILNWPGLALGDSSPGNWWRLTLCPRHLIKYGNSPPLLPAQCAVCGNGWWIDVSEDHAMWGWSVVRPLFHVPHNLYSGVWKESKQKNWEILTYILKQEFPFSYFSEPFLPSKWTNSSSALMIVLTGVWLGSCWFMMAYCCIESYRCPYIIHHYPPPPLFTTTLQPFHCPQGRVFSV